MNNNLKDIFLEKHFNYIIENIVKNIDNQKYTLNVNWNFFVNNLYFHSPIISNTEACDLINSGNSGIGSILFIYKKFGIVKDFNKLKFKNNEQEEYFNKYRNSLNRKTPIEISFFNYEIELNQEKLILFGNILYNENTKYNYSKKFLNELINIINNLDINYKEIIDILDFEKDYKYLFNNIFLLVYGLSFDEILFIKLLNFINKICNFKNLHILEFNKLLEFEGIKINDDIKNNELEETKEKLKLAQNWMEETVKNQIKDISNRKKNTQLNEFTITENIIYYKDKYLFKNIENSLEYNIKGHGDYDKMMNLLLENKGEYISYEMFSDLRVCKKNTDSRIKEKRITDVKKNLISNLKRRLDINIDIDIDFIKVDNGLKLP